MARNVMFINIQTVLSSRKIMDNTLKPNFDYVSVTTRVDW